MANTFTQVAPDSSGDKIAGQDHSRDGNTVVRQEVVISDPATAAGMATVGTGTPAAGDAGLTVKNEALGAQGDAAVATDTTGSISGKLRGLVKILADVWVDALNALGVVLRPATSGGLLIGKLISAATTNATNIKASAGQLYGWHIVNNNAAWRYVKLHNVAGAPTAGVGVVMTIGVPPGGGTNVSLEHGIEFTTGIALTTVTEAAEAGTTAVGANDLAINLFYK